MLEVNMQAGDRVRGLGKVRIEPIGEVSEPSVVDGEAIDGPGDGAAGGRPQDMVRHFRSLAGFKVLGRTEASEYLKAEIADANGRAVTTMRSESSPMGPKRSVFRTNFQPPS